MKCDCGMVELRSETDRRVQPYAKLRSDLTLASGIRHGAVGCFYVNANGVNLERFKPRRKR